MAKPAIEFPVRDSTNTERLVQTLPLTDNGAVQTGAADGAFVTLGGKTDTVPANAGAVAGSNSAISLLKAIAGWALSPILGAGEAHIGQMGSHVYVAAVTFTRPADVVPYASGDIIANNTVAGSVTVLEFTNAVRKPAGSGSVMRARVTRSKADVSNASFSLHLYRTLPTVSNGDNGVLLTNNAADYLGALDVVANQVFTNGAKGFGVPRVGGAILFDCPAGATSLFGVLEARGPIAPDSGEQFRIALEIIQD